MTVKGIPLHRTDPHGPSGEAHGSVMAVEFDVDPAALKRTTEALFSMTKIDIMAVTRVDTPIREMEVAV